MASIGGAFGGNRGLTPVPPEKGVFPLDHFHECDEAMKTYMKCLKQNKFDSEKCRQLSKAYLECRMERNLMAKQDLKELGFKEGSRWPCRALVSWERYLTRPMAVPSPGDDRWNGYQDKESRDFERTSNEMSRKGGIVPQAEGFWSCYCHLARASNLPNPTDFHLFKEGIRPLWEDAANRSGGKWIIRFKKLVSGRFWEDLVLAMIGDQLDYGDTVCGAVLSIRFGEDILSVWNRNAADNQAVMALRDSIKRHLHLPVSYVMEYKPHDASLRDNSSFRNTWLRG